MSIEIDTLVVRGSFGVQPRGAARLDTAALDDRLAALRREMLDEIARALDAAERQRREG